MLVALVAVAATLICAAQASAAAVEVSGGVLVISDNDGQGDGVTVSLSSTDVLVSAQRPLTLGAGCAADAGFPSVAKCPKPGITSVSADLGGGNDSFHAHDFTLPVTVQGGIGDDRFTGLSTETDQVDGGAGDDTIALWDTGTAGDDLRGGDGRDAIEMHTDDPTTVTLDDQPGDGPTGRADNIHSDFEIVYGGFGPDVLIGTENAEELHGRVGKDWITGGGGDDVLSGGSGGSQPCEADVLIGGAGSDRLGPLTGGDGVAGEDGNDTIVASDSSTFCTNGDVHGTDPDPGSTISGGAGVDTVSYEGPIKAAVDVSLDGAANDGMPGSNDLVGTDIENVVGSLFDDVLTGDEHGNLIVGGAGDDILDGGAGPDALGGGEGVDVVDYSSRTGALFVDLDGGLEDDGEAGEGDTVGTDVEAIWGGAGDDQLTGGPSDDLLDGADGADVLRGGPGFDAVDYSTRAAAVSVDLDGQPGDDGAVQEGDSVQDDVEAIIGGAGNDVLTGNALENAILGALGEDTIDGLAGEDYLAGDEGDDAITSRDGEFDLVDCGAGSDFARIDELDDFADCESTTTAPPPAAPPPPPPPPVAPPPPPPVAPRPPPPLAPPPPPPGPNLTPPADRLPPVLRSSVRSRLLGVTLQRGLRLVTACSEACATTTELRIGARDARRFGFGRRSGGARIAVASTPLTAGPGSFAIRVRPTSRARSRLARARQLRVEVTTTARDRAGNTRIVNTSVTLKR